MLLGKRSPTHGTTGLSFHNGGIAMAAIRRGRDGRPELLASEYLQSGDADSLEEAVKRHQLNKTHCVMALEPGTYTLLQIEAPDVEPTELRSAVRWRIRDLIDFHIDDAVLDVFEIPTSRQRGHNRPMYAVVAHRNLVQERVDLARRAGLELSAIDITELAQRNLAALTPADAGGVALLLLNRNSGLITLTCQEVLYLARQLKIGFAELQPALANPRDTGTPGSLDALVLEIQRSLDYYESHFAQPPAREIVILPPEEPISGLTEYLKNNLSMPVRMLDLTATVAGAVPEDTETQAHCLAAIGAALRVERRAL